VKSSWHLSESFFFMLMRCRDLLLKKEKFLNFNGSVSFLECQAPSPAYTSAAVSALSLVPVLPEYPLLS